MASRPDPTAKPSRDGNERELVAQCLRHDRKAWQKFVDRFSNYIFSVIMKGLRTGRFPHSREDAEDIFAEVFLSLVEKDFHLLRNFQWRCSLKTWLWVVCRKKLFRHFRKKGIKTLPVSVLEGDPEESPRPAALLSSEPDPLEVAGAAETRQILENILSEMGERDRLCLSLYFFDGLSYKEIAKILDMAVNHVGIQIFRAKKRMAKVLKEKGLVDM